MQQRPLIFFDLETTGVSTSNDRIIQVGAIKVLADGTEEVKNVLINPTIPIPAGASAIHGIYDKDVEKAPTFQQISKSFAAWLSGSDLAGYNSDNFDVPMLMAEFDRVGISFPEPDTKLVDVLKIERMVNGHTLGATYKRYIGEELDGAHDALIDIYATMKIFQKQLEKNPDLPVDAADLDALCQGDTKRVDYAGKLYKQDGDIYWKFGKYRGKKLKDTASYGKWVLGSDFPEETKIWIRKVLAS